MPNRMDGSDQSSVGKALTLFIRTQHTRRADVLAATRSLNKSASESSYIIESKVEALPGQWVNHVSRITINEQTPIQQTIERLKCENMSYHVKVTSKII